MFGEVWTQVESLFGIAQLPGAAEQRAALAAAVVARDAAGSAAGFDTSWIVDLRERPLLPDAVAASQV